jgi:cell division protein ZapA
MSASAVSSGNCEDDLKYKRQELIKLADRNKIIVKIAGNEYTLCGGETVEYIQKIALYVDRKMMEIMRANHTLSTSMASVLTAVNVTDEMVKLSELSNTLQEELEQNRKALAELSQEKLLLTQQVQKANEENKHLLLELTRREAELSEVRNTLARATGDNPPKPRLHNIK